jgi:peptidoglycan/xylan/chitin deacetylase (PgdA/CDA1 family)
MKKKVQAAAYAAFRPQFFVVAFALCALLTGALWPSPPASPHNADQHQPGNHNAKRWVPLVSRPSLQSIDCAEQNCLALTFDDGPSASITPQVLSVLAKHHVHATFFVVGSHVPGNERLLRQMYQQGHEIGNHSWSHPDLTTLPIDQLEMQYSRTQQAVTAAGVPAPTLFRPPYGAVNDTVKAHIPLTFIMWNVDPEDWRQKTPKDVVDRIATHVGPGRIVDLHDIHQPTADALDQILTDLSPRYEFVTVSQLFNLAPGQRGLYYGR